MTDKDRIDSLKVLVEGGIITRYGQLFEYVPKSVIAKELIYNYQSLTRKIQNPLNVDFPHIMDLNEVTRIDPLILSRLVLNDLNYKPTKPTKLPIHKNKLNAMIRLMKKAEVAMALGVSIKAVDKWIQYKRIPFIRISRKCVRFNPIDVQRFLDERTTKETVDRYININDQIDQETG